jgi:AraC family carnitine catabolism transcriptional activator
VHKLALLLLPEFSNFGLAAVTEPLFIANWLAQSALFEWRTLSDDGEPVRASNGAVVPVDGDLSKAAGCASVFVFASFDPARAARDRALARCLKRIARSGVELVGVENGSLALAEAGLLDHHPAAVHWDNLAGFQELFPKIRISPSRYSFTRDRATCAGASAVLDMMVAWIGQHADEGISAEVARHLLVGEQPMSLGAVVAPGRRGRAELRREPAGADALAGGGGLGVRGGAMGGDPLVARARAIMQANVDDPLPCEAVAHQVGISLRQLERRFKQQLRHTLHVEYMLVRLEKAHQYLQQTSLSVTEVSALTGFSSVEYFSKVYRRVFGVLPSTDRRQSTDAPVFRMKSPRRR